MFFFLLALDLIGASGISVFWKRPFFELAPCGSFFCCHLDSLLRPVATLYLATNLPAICR